jgi:nitrogen fixation/metabolism regulation signal transduction histidine kinase
MFNPVHFRSVMKNGLYNAVAAIRRANRHREAVPGRVTFRFEETPERLGVVIEDNGDGLSEAALARLYRGRVEQTTRRRRGGKGSLIVSSYLSFHGATSEVANRPDGGARVVFWFTKATSEAVAAAAESSPT